ncbi:MAG TPA: trypsin-like peptidase domain-containing protein, partial [Planctomycetaceae bacterium]
MTHRLVLAALLCLAPLAAAAQEPLDKLEEQAFKAAAAKVAPSVVQIQTFGGLDRVGETLTGTGPTTGVVVSEDGLVVSSAFAFAAKPAAVVVKLHDGRQVDAKVVATDYSRMLTLLKVEAAGLPVPEAAPVAEAKVGQWTLA